MQLNHIPAPKGGLRFVCNQKKIVEILLKKHAAVAPLTGFRQVKNNYWVWKRKACREQRWKK